jgi:hypothetical protein
MSDLNDDFSFEELEPNLKSEAKAFRHTDDLPRDQVWAGIEWQVRAIVRGYKNVQSAWGIGGWLRLAATLILGIYLGRASLLSPPANGPARDQTITAQVQHGWKRVVVAIAGDDRSLADSAEVFRNERLDDPFLAMPVEDSGVVHGVVRWTRNLLDTVVARAEQAKGRFIEGRAPVQDQYNQTRK